MIKITKVSAKKYEVFAIDNEFSYLIYTIKRIDHTKYIVKSMHDDIIIFNSLSEAKAFLRLERTEEDVNWLSYFVRHTKGKRFESQEQSNNHMKMLSRRWKTSPETN